MCRRANASPSLSPSAAASMTAPSSLGRLRISSTWLRSPRWRPCYRPRASPTVAPRESGRPTRWSARCCTSCEPSNTHATLPTQLHLCYKIHPPAPDNTHAQNTKATAEGLERFPSGIDTCRATAPGPGSAEMEIGKAEIAPRPCVCGSLIAVSGRVEWCCLRASAAAARSVR